MAKPPRKRTRRRFTGETITFSITLPKLDREWVDGLAKPRGVGAVEIIRDGLELYKAVLRILAPRRKTIPPILDIITTVRAALVAYLAQQCPPDPESREGQDE